MEKSLGVVDRVSRRKKGLDEYRISNVNFYLFGIPFKKARYFRMDNRFNCFYNVEALNCTAVCGLCQTNAK